MNAKKTLSAEARRKTILSAVLAVICVIYVLPVVAVVINSFKLNTFVKTDTFALPTGEMYAGFENFIKGMTFGNYPFAKSVLYSVVITLLSTALILLCTSMAAWYITPCSARPCTSCACSPWWSPSRWSCSPCPKRPTACVCWASGALT